MSHIVRKERCWKCHKEGRDSSGDNASFYSDGGVYCWAGHGLLKLSDTLAAEKENDNWELNLSIEFTQEELDKLKQNTTFSGKGFRGIRDDIYKHFAVLHEYDQETGALAAQYYPVTEIGEFAGFKLRKIPKTFHCLTFNGKGVSNNNDLFGQFRFKNSTGKYVLVTAGEIDQLSAYQMLSDYQAGKGYEPTPVVSPTTGETGSHKQLQNQYEWFNRFERIILCYDQDEAGQKAIEKAAKVLPKGKVFIMDLPMKDTNEMLMAGKEKEWINCFFKARQYTPTGIVGSDQLFSRVLEEAKRKKIPFPPFMKGVSEITAGGIPLRNVVNMAAVTGGGKTTFVNELIYFWIFNSPHKVGVVSMELDAGQYGEVILSRHIGKKIALIPQEDKLAFLEQEWVQEKAEHLYKKINGEARWYLVEDRDGELESIKKTVEQMIVSLECKVIVLDPIQDLLDGLSNDEQAVFMRWQKQMIKTYDVVFINISHIRKLPTKGDKGFITEDDFHGSSSIVKTGACNIIFSRDKYADDPIERNTTNVYIPKCRWSGFGGPAGAFYYDNNTHTLWDKGEWLRSCSNLS